MRLIYGTLTALGLLMASSAIAQGEAAINVGMQVTDASGGPVGSVKAVEGTNLLIHTDKHDALLPKTSFTVSDGKLLFGMTQAQLDAEIEKNLAASSAAIAAGATVKGLAGTQVGTIDAVADGKATISLEDGKKIAVPEEGLRGNPDGSVTIGYSAAQLEALVQGGTSSTSTSTSSTSPGTSGN
jgi:preprotein translocase subunit YajC